MVCLHCKRDWLNSGAKVRLGLDRLGLVRLNANSTFRHRHILS